MNDNKFSVVLTEGAQAFLESLPHEAKEKIAWTAFSIADAMVAFEEGECAKQQEVKAAGEGDCKIEFKEPNKPL